MSGLDELDKLTDDAELFWVTIAIGGAVLMAFVAGLVVGLWVA